MTACGNANIVMTPWEDAKDGEEGTIMGLKAIKMRKLDMLVYVKNNPMVSQAPTTKTYYLIE